MLPHIELALYIIWTLLGFQAMMINTLRMHDDQKRYWKARNDGEKASINWELIFMLFLFAIVTTGGIKTLIEFLGLMPK